MPSILNHDALANYLQISLFPQIAATDLPNYGPIVLTMLSNSTPRQIATAYRPELQLALARIVSKFDPLLSQSEMHYWLCDILGIRFADENVPSIVELPAKLHSYEKRQPSKLGRVLRRYLNCPDQTIELILNTFLDEHDPARLRSAFDFKEGDKPEDFETCYLADVANGDSGARFSSLKSSCMQGKTYGRKSPARAYGSGDFVIYSAWKEDKIAARVIVTSDHEAATPIYACGNAAGVALMQWIEQEKDIDLDNLTEDLSGYSMKAIEVNGVYLMPYLDCREYLSFNGDHFYIGRGDIETDQSGYVSDEPQGYCECCDDRVPEDELNYVDDCSICDSCLRSNYTQSDLSGEYFHDDNKITYIGRNGRHYNCGDSETDDLCYSEYHEDYIHSEYAIHIKSIDDYVHVDDNTEELEGELYLVDSREYLDKKEEIEQAELEAKLEAEETGFYIGRVGRIDDPAQLDFDPLLDINTDANSDLVDIEFEPVE